MSVLVPAVIAMAAFTALTLGCRGARQHDSRQQALFVAEAGVEVAKLHLREACADPHRREALFRQLAAGELAIPGFATPATTALGHPLGGTLTLRVRAVADATNTMLVRATGESRGVTQVVEVRLQCSV